MAKQLERLEAELRANRDRYNTLFALAKRARPRLRSDAFGKDLLDYLGPIAESLPRERTSLVVADLYDLLLELSSLELFARSRAVHELWQHLLPQASSLLGEKPGFTVSALTNAAYNLEREPAADWRFWLAQMESAVTCCESPEQWLQAGQVLAWVSGMAHFRESACELASTMPEDLVKRLVPRWDRVQRDPWWSRRPEGDSVHCVHRVGAFLGFGGDFRRPPELVTAGENRFLVSDGTDEWLLFCDGFGATLKRVANFELAETSAAKVVVENSGEVKWKGETFAFPELQPVLSFDVSGEVLAVTSALSHRIYLFLLSGAS